MTAQFEFRRRSYYIDLIDVEIYQMQKSGIKSIIGRLKQRVWLGLKLDGESATIREIKYKGLIQ